MLAKLVPFLAVCVCIHVVGADQQLTLIVRGDRLSRPWADYNNPAIAPLSDNSTSDVLNFPGALLDQAYQVSVLAESEVCENRYKASFVRGDIAPSLAIDPGKPVACGLYRNNALIDQFAFDGPFDDTNTAETRCVYRFRGMQCDVDTTAAALLDSGDTLVAACDNLDGTLWIEIALCAPETGSARATRQTCWF